MENSQNFKVLLVSSGSVASLKVPLLVEHLINENCEVRVVATDRAQTFLEVEHPMHREVQVLTDACEWSSWNARGDPVMHIDLMQWADILVIAPMSANTLAKISQGICDNLATCVARAWPLGSKAALFCPAMNTHMWKHPITATQVATLKSWGYIEVPCIEKTLICGQTGLGAMAEVQTIVNSIISLRPQKRNVQFTDI